MTPKERHAEAQRRWYAKRKADPELVIFVLFI